MKDLYLTSSSGSLFQYNIQRDILTEVFQTPNSNEYLLGITFNKKILYFASNYVIYQYNLEEDMLNVTNISPLGNMMIQHIKCIGNYLFVPCLNTNGILILHVEKLTKIPYYIVFNSSAIKTYGDHISDITFDGKNFIIQFCSVRGQDSTEGQESDFPRTSGLIYLDTNLNIVYRKTNGLEVVLTEYVNNKLYSISNYFNKSTTNGALIVGKQSVTSWSTDYTIYDITITNENIFLVGKLHRKNDNLFGGIVIHLDKNYDLVSSKYFHSVGYFLGCSSEDDQTNLFDVPDNLLNIDNWQEKKDEIITIYKDITV